MEHTHMPPISSVSIDDRIRFWSSYDRRGPEDCWPSRTAQRYRPEESLGSGYGVFKLKRQVYKSHRVAYFLHHGVDPGSLKVLHSCDFPPGCNPSHLSLGTISDNMKEAYARNRKFNYGEAGPNARLTREQVVEIKKFLDQGILSLAEIGRRFDVDRTVIWKIKEGKIWWCV